MSFNKSSKGEVDLGQCAVNMGRTIDNKSDKPVFLLELMKMRRDVLFQNLLNLQLKVDGDDRVIMADANFVSAHSEYIEEAIKYQIEVSDSLTYPIKLTIPDIDYNTLNKIVDTMYGEDLSSKEGFDKHLCAYIKACDFLRANSLISQLDQYISDQLRSRAPFVEDDLLSTIMEHFRNSNSTSENKCTLKALSSYFQCFADNLIFNLKDEVITQMICNLPFTFLTLEEVKACFDHPILPLYTEYRRKFQCFLDNIPQDRTELREKLEDMFPGAPYYSIYNGIPDRMDEWPYAGGFGNHNRSYFDFAETEHRGIDLWEIVPKTEWKLNAVTFYYTNWNNEGASYIAGFKTEYLNIHDGRIEEKTPFDFSVHHTEIPPERCELLPDELIIDIEVNSGYVIDRMAFRTSKGRALGPFGTSTGGNLSKLEPEYKFFSKSNLLHPIALYGFVYDVIMSSNKPMVNNLRFQIAMANDRNDKIHRSLENVFYWQEIVRNHMEEK